MTLAEAYRIAVDMQSRFGEQAVHVAGERADACRGKGDAAGFGDWNKVCAMLRELGRADLRTVQ